jgi:hypothetical protein
MTRPRPPRPTSLPLRRRGLRRRMTDNITARRDRRPEADPASARTAGLGAGRLRRRDRVPRSRAVAATAPDGIFGAWSSGWRPTVGDPRSTAPPQRTRRLSRRSSDPPFTNHARYYVELARAPKFTAAWVNERLEVENAEETAAWMKERRALILIGMHFGAIEVPGIFAVHRLGRIVSPDGDGRQCPSPALHLLDAGHHRRPNRDPGGGRRGASGGASPQRAGRAHCRPRHHGGGIEVELFGARTKIPAGPVLLAAETGAPMYVSAVRRVGPGRYRGSLRQLQPPEGASRRERSRAMAQEEARLFEHFIIEAPEQWLALLPSDLARPGAAADARNRRRSVTPDRTARLGQADMHIHSIASDGTASAAQILDYVGALHGPGRDRHRRPRTHRGRGGVPAAGTRARQPGGGRRRRGSHDAQRPSAGSSCRRV